MRRLLTALLVSSLLALAACAAPHSQDAVAATPAADAAQAAAPQPTRVRAPEPAPKERQAEPAEQATTPIKLDFSCSTDADCAVKNVGNCCGAKPACVNANSPTDPEGVKAECARKGMMAMCGFKAIEGCTCEQGQCKDKIAEVEAVH